MNLVGGYFDGLDVATCERKVFESDVTVVSCPDDPELGCPLYDPRATFPRTQFMLCLQDGIWPEGMVVRLLPDSERRTRTYKVVFGLGYGYHLQSCDGLGRLDARPERILP